MRAGLSIHYWRTAAAHFVGHQVVIRSRCKFELAKNTSHYELSPSLPRAFYAKRRKASGAITGTKHRKAPEATRLLTSGGENDASSSNEFL